MSAGYEGGRPRPLFALPEEERRGVYRAIHLRRDVRRFRPDPVPDAVLARVLEAAHHAPSVGFMQPWDLLLVRDLGTRRRVKDVFERERLAAAPAFDEPRRARYLSFKLEGILEAPLNVCVTSDPTRAGPAVIGRNTTPETDVYSTCCAVQNLWLAARAEGLGVGWVSILTAPELREILGIPVHVTPVAYLCVGYPEDLPERPELERAGWLPRRPLAQAVRYERWASDADPYDWRGLQALLEEDAGGASRTSEHP